MTGIGRQAASRVFEALRKCAPTTERIDVDRWAFTLANGRVLGVSAQAVEGWLALDAALEDHLGRSEFWSLLELNGRLDGPAKFALGPAASAPQLRAEVPLDEEVDLVARLHEACDGFKTALEALKAQPDRGDEADGHLGATRWPEDAAAEPHALISLVPGDVDAGSVDLAALCSEAGWPATLRSSGTAFVDLEVPGGFYQALLNHGVSGALRVSVRVASGERNSGERGLALAGFLLIASGCVRLARPAVRRQQHETAAFFEVCFASAPSAVELAHAYSALSVACRLCGREAKAFEDERVARAFLAARGFCE